MKKIALVIIAFLFLSCSISDIGVISRIDQYLPPGASNVRQEKRYWYSFECNKKMWYIYINESGYGDTLAFFPKEDL